MSITRLADFIATPRQMSDATRSLVRLHVIDALGALIAASRTPEGEMLLRFRARAGVADDVASRAMTLCALARLSEIDDIHLASMTTPGAIVIPAALAIAAAQGDDGDAFVAAILAGYEAMIRLGVALDGPTILYRGIWPTYIAAPFGVAATASRLLGLSAEQTAQALALALIYAAPGVGHHNAPTTARWIAVGQAARNGFAAARAAQAGFTADLNLLDGGFFPGVYAISPNTAALSDDLGARDPLAEVSFKPWCAARQTMAATQALKELLAEGVRADGIVAVKAAILPPHRRMIDHGVRSGDRASYLTSLSYNMAVAAVAPELADVLSPARLPEAVSALMQRIAVEPDERLLARYPSVWPAQVAVTTAAGTRTCEVASIAGDPANPFGEADVTAKFRRFATPAIGEGRAGDVLKSIDADSPAALLRRIESVVG
jgi:2-methylcitrate dehydratase PrpD